MRLCSRDEWMGDPEILPRRSRTTGPDRRNRHEKAAGRRRSVCTVVLRWCVDATPAVSVLATSGHQSVVDYAQSQAPGDAAVAAYRGHQSPLDEPSLV